MEIDTNTGFWKFLTRWNTYTWEWELERGYGNICMFWRGVFWAFVFCSFCASAAGFLIWSTISPIITIFMGYGVFNDEGIFGITVIIGCVIWLIFFGVLAVLAANWFYNHHGVVLVKTAPVKKTSQVVELFVEFVKAKHGKFCTRVTLK